MKKIFFLLSIMIVLLTTQIFAQVGWQWQNPLPQGNNLYDLSQDAVNPGKLFAVGDQGTILRKENLSDWQIVEQGNFDNLYSIYFKGNYGWAVGYSGTILQNIDGVGNTWYPLNNSGTDKQLLSVFFFDQLNGWIVGQDQTILKTTDGGSHWNSMSPTGSENYFSVCFTSLLNGWIAGTAGSNGVIKKTTDGGTIWTNSLIPTSRMNSIKFIDENIGCVVGDAGKIYRTSNAGTNWNLAVSNTTSDLRDFYMNSSGEGCAVGYDGTIIKTTDYGSTWNNQTSPTNQIIYGIEGDYAVGWAGTILHRGTNWEIESTGFTNHLSGIGFSADATRGFAIGEEGLILTTTDGGNTWVQDNSGTNYDLYAIDVTNYSDGTPVAIITGEYGKVLTGSKGNWHDRSIQTTDRLYAAFRFVSGKAWVAGEFGRIWKTTDSGQSWVLQHENTGYHLYTIQFVSKNYGWAAGMSGSILKTTNSGDDWINVSPNNFEFFRSIYFLDYDNGWVVGNGGAIYSTTDGGNSWIELLPKVTYETLNKILFVNESIGWIVGSAGSIFLTTDGGVNWHQQNSPSNSFMISACFPETGSGWICGRDGAILYTTDGGGTISYEIYERNNLNLSIPDPGETSDIIDVQIVPKTLIDLSLSGVTVLLDSVIHPEVSDLVFILSHDGVTDTLITQSEITGSNIFYCSLSEVASNPLEEGESPYGGSYKPHSPLSVFSGMNPNGEWTLKISDLISGNSGTLQAWGLKLFFDAPTNVKSDNSVGPNNFEVYQNYPNPFNPSTRISWQSPVGSHQTIKLFNVLGKEIESIVEGYYEAGFHSTLFTVNSSLSSGVYFYRLQAGSFVQTKKMMYIK